ncbi:MAG: FAD-dependent oxidoreductase [Chromatiales bacterium]|nr:MAG: FAD-dependent oxidoreductase [Chromatiales bacterium]
MSDSSKPVSRRDLLTGAAAATLGAGALGACQASPGRQWDQAVDIVVVGSGAAAATAAVIASDNGDSVLMLEKASTVGGTAAKSAGVLWVPDNFTLRERGIEDLRDDCLRYMARFAYPERYDVNSPTLGVSPGEFSLLEAFYDNASPAMDRLRDAGALNLAEWRMFALDRPATDYLDNVPENKVPAGRALGPVDAEGKMGLGTLLMEQLHAAINARDIPVLTGHRVVRVVLNGDGRVVGVEADKDGAILSVGARKAVIFGTGGYVHNPEFISKYQRTALVGACAKPDSTGDFINIGGAAGARLGNLSCAWRSQVVLDEVLVNRVLGAGVFYPPGDSMLQVNRYGMRAVNEHRNYNDRTEIHSVYNPSRAEFPNQLMFMVYDQRTAEAFAGVYPIPSKPADAPAIAGDSLADLADKLDARLAEIADQTGGLRLDPAFADKLATTVARFNGFAQAGRDDDFRRGEAAYDTEWHPVFSPMRADTDWPANDSPNITMHPLRDEGPYYAIILAAGALDTCGGPVIDAKARVLDTQDQPIPGLYGAGNCIASPSREAYYGAGHTLGHAVTFGYIAANAAHDETPAGADA